jgi:hypothetical protein
MRISNIILMQRTLRQDPVRCEVLTMMLMKIPVFGMRHHVDCIQVPNFWRSFATSIFRKVQKSELCRGEDTVGNWSRWPKEVPSPITSHKTGIFGENLILNLKFDVKEWSSATIHIPHKL